MVKERNFQVTNEQHSELKPQFIRDSGRVESTDPRVLRMEPQNASVI
jgi:hypothetical protein